MVLTSLPSQRRARYNCFYFTHLAGALLFFFFVSVHASTDFYFLLPGLVLWLADWAARLRWLRKNRVEARLEDAGDGWYRIRLPPAPATRGDGGGELAAPRDRPPLQAFYLNFPAVSTLQCHAFTAAAVGSGSDGPTFLFRRAEGKKQPKLDKEWTWKLGALASAPSTAKEAPSTALSLRLEGPYSTSAVPLHTAARVLCLVGGTGITGALSLARAWLRHRGADRAARFRLVWTVRAPETARVAEVQALQADSAARAVNMEVVVHVSRTDGRIDPTACLAEFFEPAALPPPAQASATEPGALEGAISPVKGGDEKAQAESADAPDAASGWVYCSGPAGLLDATDAACLGFSRRLRAARAANGAPSSRAGVARLDWYCAKWEV